MKKFLSLVKLLFAQQYRIKPQQGKKKKGGTIAVFIVLGLCFLPMLIGIGVGMYYLGLVSRNVDNPNGVCTMLIFMCQGLVLLFGIPTLISNVFTTKDADKLLFLPVRSSTLFAAKLTVVYLNEVITTAVTIIVVLFPFGSGLSAGAGYFLTCLLALVLIPMLPMLLGCIVAIPLSALVAKIGKNGLVRTILQVLMFVIIMGAYVFIAYQFGFMGGGIDGGEMSEEQIAQILLEKIQNLSNLAIYIHPDYALAGAMVGASVGAVLLNLLMAVGENALLLGLVILLSLPFYHWILTASTEGEGGSSRKRRSAQTELQVKNKGVLRELIFTDIKRVTRDSQMGFQCVLSLIVLPIMVVLFSFLFNTDTGDGDTIAVIASQPLYQAIAPLVFVVYMSLLGMTSNVLGIFPISRENKSIYIIKSLPLSFKKYLLAKVILSTSAMLISDTVTCILVVALFKIDWYYGLLMLIAMALLGFGAMCITTLIDLKSPKIGWTNFNQSLKNAKNNWMAMLVGLICMVVLGVIAGLCIVGYSLTNGWYMLVIMWLLIIGLAAGFATVSYRIMAARAQKYFDSIEP